jgi:hypothetical protein
MGGHQVVHAGCGIHQTVDQTKSLINADMGLHAKAPLIAFFRLMHIWVTFAFPAFGRTGRINQAGINDRTFP